MINWVTGHWSWASFLPIFSLLHPSTLDRARHGTVRRTDDGNQRLMPPPHGGGDNKKSADELYYRPNVEYLNNKLIHNRMAVFK